MSLFILKCEDLHFHDTNARLSCLLNLSAIIRAIFAFSKEVKKEREKKEREHLLSLTGQIPIETESRNKNTQAWMSLRMIVWHLNAIMESLGSFHLLIFYH
jgi:hypothetical protein